jgi:hypothetical protein
VKSTLIFGFVFFALLLPVYAQDQRIDEIEKRYSETGEHKSNQDPQITIKKMYAGIGEQTTTVQFHYETTWENAGFDEVKDHYERHAKYNLWLVVVEYNIAASLSTFQHLMKIEKMK